VKSEAVQQREVVEVGKIVPLSLENLVGFNCVIDDHISCFLGKSDVALSLESDFFGTMVSTHTCLNLEDFDNNMGKVEVEFHELGIAVFNLCKSCHPS
jgi:hypothetical protein